MLTTAEHQALFDTTQRFVENEINPNVEDWEREGLMPAHALMKKAGELGILGIDKPTEFGGMGLDFSYQAAFAEALGTADHGSSPMMIGVQTMMATPALAKHGSDELRREFLAPAVAGDMVCSIAVSEPGAGSDVAGLKTQARRDGDDYVINGNKMWITNSTQADFFCLLANTSEGPQHKNKSLIIVPRNTPGITVGPKLDKLGMRASDTAPVFFDDVRVPQRNRIGSENMGFIYQMEQFQEERLYAALSSLRMLDKCIRVTIDYTRERKAFGKSLLDNQIMHFRLAELQTEVQALRSLTYDACARHVAGEDVTLLASMAKLKTGRVSQEVTTACLQYWGGMGFMWDNYVGRAMRDCRLSSVGGGSDETMLGIICKKMGTHP